MEIFGVPTQALYGQLLIGLINGSFYALLSLGLAATWLLLNGSIAPATLLLAVLVGLIVPNVMRTLRPDVVRLRALGTILRLASHVLYDVLRSNRDVAKLTGKSRATVEKVRRLQVLGSD